MSIVGGTNSIGSHETVSVFVLAENRLLRESLRRVLQKKPGIRVVGECPYTDGAVHLVAESRCEILLLDCAERSISNSDRIVEILEAIPDLKILLIDADENGDSFLSAVRSGVVGYVLKESSTLEVLAAVRAVANGEAVCPPRLCLSLFRHITAQARGISKSQGRAEFGLTQRQQQLVSFLAKGWSNKEIANSLHLSEQTVKNHVHRILRQVNAENRSEAVNIVRGSGFLV
jgi:DNA-binding NarL/FixJ family response regulator